ncbi:MAG: hypothetical protein AAFY27_08410, partial [Pseudomonadota bacterium]
VSSAMAGGAANPVNKLITSASNSPGVRVNPGVVHDRDWADREHEHAVSGFGLVTEFRPARG